MKKTPVKKKLPDTFEGLESLLGPLSWDAKWVMLDPTDETWHSAQSIILNGSPHVLTLWQAVIAVDPTFPRVGRSVDRSGKVVVPWARIPDSLLIARAIRYARGKSK